MLPPTSYLRIVWNDEFKPLKVRSSPEQIQKGCSALGDSMKPGRGLAAFGLFPRFGCFSQGKLLTGQDGLSAWVLLVEEGDRQITISLMRESLNSKPVTGWSAPVGLVAVGRVKLPGSPWISEFFQDQQFSRLVALAVTASLPAVRLVENAKSLTERHFLQADPMKLGFNMPKDLHVFGVNGDQSWTLHALGSARWVAQNERLGWQFEYSKKVSTESGRMLMTGFRREQPLDRNAVIKALSQRFMALSKARNLAVFEETLRGSQSTTQTLLKQATAEAYVGLRAGHSLVPKKTDILYGANMLGVLAEFRDGIAKGFRVYYDAILRNEKKIRNVNFYYESNRIIAGYGFIFEPRFLLSRIDLAPKIGYWQLDARLPFINQANTIDILNFHTKKNIGLGGEARAEIHNFGSILSGWITQDVTLNVLTDQLGPMANSQRIGLDLFVPGPLLGHARHDMHLAFLGFWLREDTRLRTQSPSNFLIQTIANYVGLGVSIDW